MIEKAFAEQFASHWIDAWNSHDIDRILSYHVDDFVMHSPAILRVAVKTQACSWGKTRFKKLPVFLVIGILGMACSNISK